MQYRNILCAIAIPCFFATFPAGAQQVEVVEEIIAKVNDAVVTNTEIENFMSDYQAQLVQQGITGAALQQALNEQRPHVLRNRIDLLLLRQRGRDLGVNVEDQVNRQVADYQREFELPDPDEFADFVEQETGQSYADFRDSLRDQLITDIVVREEIMRRINFSSEETMRYYDEHMNDFQREERVFLREIFVSTAGLSGTELEEANTKAQTLAERGKRGEPFAQLAVDNSESITAEQGGLLDPARKGDLAESIESMVWDAERGFVTDPIKLDQGWLILKVEDHQRAGLASYEEALPEIQNTLFERRRDPAQRAYFTKLREDAFIQIKDGWEDTGATPGKSTTWGELATLTPETVSREDVLLNPGRKRLLGMFPVPGTSRSGESSSR